MRMHYRAFIALGITLCATTIVDAQSAATRIAPSKGWLNDLEKGKALALKTGKPMMVVFRCDP